MIPLEKKAYIQTFGCQMNDHDSHWMGEILSKEGYALSETIESADLIIVNTCSVRENAENKVYSLLGRLKIFKEKNKELIIGVGGCVAQQEGKTILKRVKAVDMVFGTDNFFRLPEMLQKVEKGERVLLTSWMPREQKVQNFIPEEELNEVRTEGPKGLVAITKGCDNYCTFCIVPETRGPLVSREPENILQEIKNLIDGGIKEVLLLGQNVNSYRAGSTGFLELLQSVANLKGLKRLRFTSPHPNDWNSDLTELIANHPVICNQIHLPFQSGSDSILSDMKRGHTIQRYLEQIGILKEKIPDIAISTDIIVGFPGETDSDFKKTLDVIREVRFNQIYAFKFSVRPGTKASKMIDDVSTETKEKRLDQLLKLYYKIQSEHLDHLVDTEQEVLIDFAHPRERHAMNGRTEGNFAVTIPDSDLQIGDLINLKIIGRKEHSLVGQVIGVN